MKEIILPSGRNAIIRDGKGKDLLNAHRIAGDPSEIIYALLAELSEIEGQKIILDDLMEMDLRDVFALQTEIAGNFILGPSTSFISQKQQAGGSEK